MSSKKVIKYFVNKSFIAHVGYSVDIVTNIIADYCKAKYMVIITEERPHKKISTNFDRPSEIHVRYSFHDYSLSKDLNLSTLARTLRRIYKTCSSIDSHIRKIYMCGLVSCKCIDELTHMDIPRRRATTSLIPKFSNMDHFYSVTFPAEIIKTSLKKCALDLPLHSVAVTHAFRFTIIIFNA
jgi:hypothetical protein